MKLTSIYNGKKFALTIVSKNKVEFGVHFIKPFFWSSWETKSFDHNGIIFYNYELIYISKEEQAYCNQLIKNRALW